MPDDRFRELYGDELAGTVDRLAHNRRLLSKAEEEQRERASVDRTERMRRLKRLADDYLARKTGDKAAVDAVKAAMENPELSLVERLEAVGRAHKEYLMRLRNNRRPPRRGRFAP